MILRWKKKISVRDRFDRADGNFSLGKRGEELAAEYLKRVNYRIVATNFVAPIGFSRKGRQITGEIDIIAYDESSQPFTLSFIEVKTRSNVDIAPPEAAVDLRKQRHIIKAAQVYRRVMNLHDEPFRYDVVSVFIAPDADAEINLLQGYFVEQRFWRSIWHLDRI